MQVGDPRQPPLGDSRLAPRRNAAARSTRRRAPRRAAAAPRTAGVAGPARRPRREQRSRSSPPSSASPRASAPRPAQHAGPPRDDDALPRSRRRALHVVPVLRAGARRDDEHGRHQQRAAPSLGAHDSGVAPECPHLLHDRLHRHALRATRRSARRATQYSCAQRIALEPPEPVGELARARPSPSARTVPGESSITARSKPRARRSSSAPTARSSSSGREREHERVRRQRPRRDHVEVLPRVAEHDLRVEQRVDDPVELRRSRPRSRSAS